MATKTARSRLSPSLISLAVASCFSAGTALANPTNGVTAYGTPATITNPAANVLNIQTYSPQTIINWGSFSIQVGELTRFMQPSALSAVLNRVGVGASPSAILGALESNGRVFLINPNGIVFGAGAQINVAGLVASTLNLSDADFLAGRMRFADGLGKSVVNEGNITTGAGGSVYLVGSAVTNSGIIASPQGEVILAAGNSVELVNPGTPNLRVEIAALDHEARDLGEIIADSGRIGIYAGLISHSGAIRADSAVATEDGRIVLKATKNATLEAGSVTTANGPAGGSVTIQSGDTTLVAGTVEAKGTEGRGGTIQLLGNLVGVIDNAEINASGESGGGTVLVGGDFQGRNPDVQNAFRTYFGPGATIAADAVTSGDGGKVIVWSDDATRAYGMISARGGAQSGNGGFAETSGHYLEVTRAPDLWAPHGKGGIWLLDPLNLDVVAGNVGLLQGGTFAPSSSASQIGADVIAAALTAGTSVTLTTVGTIGAEAGDINVNAAIIAAPSPASTSLSLIAANNININQSITLTAGVGAPASVTLSAAGAITVNGSAVTTAITAFGGTAGPAATGGSAQVTLNAGSNITLMNNSSILASGAAGTSGGGDATVTLISGGDIIAPAGSVNASAGTGSPNGTARIVLTFLTPNLGAQVVNNILVGAVNQQIDVLAAQLTAGEAGGIKEEEKKLPLCN
jgi:filamentous hemagglutinin family protein